MDSFALSAIKIGQHGEDRRAISELWSDRLYRELKKVPFFAHCSRSFLNAGVVRGASSFRENL